MSESCCANTAEKYNQKDFFLQLLHKNVSSYPTWSKHIISISKSEGPYCGHEKRQGLFFL